MLFTDRYTPRKRFFLYPYGPSVACEGVRAGLDGLLIKREGSKYVNKANHTVINWGSYGVPPVLRGVRVLNPFAAVEIASSKLKTFEALNAANVECIEWTRDIAVARDWAARNRVVGRDLDRGSQGNGTVVYERGTVIPQHRFYTKYFRKNREFRIHVAKGQVIFRQEKLRKEGVENADKYIRSHDRGWCFAFHHFSERPVPASVDDAAQRAVVALGLDFGAVDIGWHRDNGVRVFEVNTAPGIEETSLAKYVETFQQW